MIVNQSKEVVIVIGTTEGFVPITILLHQFFQKDLWCHIAPVGHNELMQFIWDMSLAKAILEYCTLPFSYVCF